jgi:hypothetical protein
VPILLSTKHYAYHSEAGQVVKIHFSWAKIEGDNYRRQLRWYTCRDWLTGWVHLTRTKQEWEAIPSHFEDTGLLVLKVMHSSLVPYLRNLQQNLHILNNYEKMYGTELSKVVKLEDEDGGEAYLISIPPFWRQAAFLLSLYIFLLKVLATAPSQEPKTFLSNAAGNELQLLLGVGEDDLYKYLDNLHKIEYDKYVLGSRSALGTITSSGFYNTLYRGGSNEYKTALMKAANESLQSV